MFSCEIKKKPFILLYTSEKKNNQSQSIETSTNNVSMMSRQCPPDMPCSICFALLNAVAFGILMFHFVHKQWRSDYLEYNHFAECDSEVGLA